MGDGSATVGAPNYLIAARVLRVLSWAQIAIPVAAIVVTLPGSLYVLLLGGVIIVAPPIALAVIGLGIARGLVTGRRIAAAVVLTIVQTGAYAALAFHSRTWDPSTRGEANFFLLMQIVFWMASIANLSVPFVLAVRTPSRKEGPVPVENVDLTPPLWPWIVAAIVIMSLIVLGIWVPGEG